MDHIDVDFAQSLVQLHPVGETHIEFLPGSLIYVAREQLAAQAITMNADYILWLDSDVTFNPELLADLIAHDKDFVTGIYFRRRPPFSPTIFSEVRYGETAEEYKAVNYDDYPLDSTFEIDACGFGAVLMKTQVMRDVLDQYGQGFTPMRGFGEDISFCIRAKQCGYKLWCDSSIKLGHVTRSVSNEDTYLALKARQ